MPVIDDPVYGYQKINVASQEKDPDSHLNMIRSLMLNRKASHALCYGKLVWLTGEGDEIPVLAYIRQSDSDSVWVIQNMTDDRREFSVDLPEGIYTDLNHPEINISGGKNTAVSLGPREFFWLHKKD